MVFPGSAGSSAGSGLLGGAPRLGLLVVGGLREAFGGLRTRAPRRAPRRAAGHGLRRGLRLWHAGTVGLVFI